MSAPPVAAYASKDFSHRPFSPTAAAIGLCVIGVLLIGVGGCFLIGVMLSIFSLVTPNSQLGVDIFVCVLYACAFCCFGGAALMLWLGVRRLIGLLNA